MYPLVGDLNVSGETLLLVLVVLAIIACVGGGMTVSASDPFRSAPRISRNRFRQVLQHHAAPGVIAERDTGAYYDAIVRYGIDPLLILAIFQHESTMGRYGQAVTSHLWGNTTRPSFGVPDIGLQDKKFSVYRDWLDGVISTAARLASPTHVYRNRTAIRDIFIWPPDPEVVWAPSNDENDPDSYLAAVIRDMNSWADVTPAPAGDMAGVPFVPADSRHHTKSRTVAWPDLLIQHHTDGYDSLVWLTTSPNSNVSATYLMNRDGTPRAQLVRHSDTPHTTGEILNPRSITSEWERKWGDPAQYDIPDTTYRDLERRYDALERELRTVTEQVARQQADLTTLRAENEKKGSEIVILRNRILELEAENYRLHQEIKLLKQSAS